MIRVQRGLEPPQLAKARVTALTTLRALGREPASDDITGYRCVSDDLWRAQHYKCCYCERKLSERFNDVEHYRPKARADRSPGGVIGGGYWWLAFTWSNLLFACPSCNRSEKNDSFPLARGSTSLTAEQDAPGMETPLLIDPGAQLVNPVVHIRFMHAPFVGAAGLVRWWAFPRHGSELGAWTIDVCGLNRGDMPELRDDHIDTCVRQPAKDLLAFAAGGNKQAVEHQFRQCLDLFRPQRSYAALSYDALRHLVPNSVLKPWRLSWPQPRQVG